MLKPESHSSLQETRSYSLTVSWPRCSSVCCLSSRTQWNELQRSSGAFSSLACSVAGGGARRSSGKSGHHSSALLGLGKGLRPLLSFLVHRRFPLVRPPFVTRIPGSPDLGKRRREIPALRTGVETASLHRHVSGCWESGMTVPDLGKTKHTWQVKSDKWKRFGQG